MATEPTKSQIVWFDVPVKDLDRAIRFYSAVLSCEIARQDFGGFAMGILPHEGPAIGGCLVQSAEYKPSDQGILIYLNCDGRLDAAIAAVQPNGGEIVQEKHSIAPHGWRAIVKDSEGNRVALHSM